MPRIEENEKLDFCDVLLRPKRSELRSRADVDLTREYQFRHSNKKYNNIPIIASNMDTVGTFEMAEKLAEYSLFTTIHKHYTPDQWRNFIQGLETDPDKKAKVVSNLAVSAGTSDADRTKVRTIFSEIPEINYLCLDVANGYSQQFVDCVRRYREENSEYTIFAGNVVTGEMTEELILAGADVVKVGIGPGSVCTTRKMTGVGYPQLSAILECADAAHGLRGHVISDGGCAIPGDVAKAFGAGADFVMLGGLLAGHDQSGGQIIEKEGKRYKLFYGMASETGQVKHHGSLENYRASEGKTITIPYRGDVCSTVQGILGGLRSACTYTGAKQLKELSKRATFIRVRRQTNEIFTPFETCD